MTARGALSVLCLFLSGASSLVLEVVWVKQLTQVFGSTTLALSTVLAAFMAGLALGSYLGGRFSDRRPSQGILWYAACELAVIVSAALLLLVLGHYHELNAWLWSVLGDWPWFLALARFVFAFAAMLGPTLFMGATLPLMVRAVATDGDLPQTTSALYAANIVGATFGVWWTGFALIPSFGTVNTTWLALSMDGAAALLALALHRRASKAPPQVEPRPTAQPAVHKRLILASLFFSGALAMSLEVILTRGLSLVIGSSTYSYTIVLATYLAGLTLAPLWLARAKPKRPERILAWAFGLGSLAIALSHLILDDLPETFLALLVGAKLELGTIFFLQSALAALALLPAAAALGAVVPVGIAAYAQYSERSGKRLGGAYAVNTMGSITGSFAGGFLIIPLVGLNWGLRGAAVVSAVLCAFWVWRSTPKRWLRALPALAAVLALVLPAWDITALTSGVFRMSLARRFVQAGDIARPEVLYYRDGIATTVTVERHGSQVAMKNNGKVEASSRADMATQINVGLLPVMLHGDKPKDVLVIGYGSGVTVGATAVSPHVRHVDTVELEPAVYEAADRYFAHVNHRVHENPIVKRHVGDGRNFLLSSDRQYDVIVSEPSNPWIAGVANLFSRDFYEFSKEHLSPGGIFCQWVQMYEFGPRNVKTVYRTFSQSFPYVYAFAAADLTADTILIGSMEAIDLNVIYEQFQVPEIAAELRRGGVDRATDWFAMMLLREDEVHSFGAGGEIHTDQNGFLEYAAPKDLLAAGRGGQRFADSIYGDGWPYGDLNQDEVQALPAARADSLVRSLIYHGRRKRAANVLAQSMAELDEVAKLARAAERKDVSDPEEPLGLGEDIPSELQQGYEAWHKKEWEKAYAALRGLPIPDDTPAGKMRRLLFGAVLYKTFRFEAAVRLLEPIADESQPAAYYLGRSLYGLGKFRQGATYLEDYLRANN